MTKGKYPVLERAAAAQRRYNAQQVLARAKAVLAGTYVPPPARHSRVDVEYQIAGLEAEIADGLSRLERADGANDHVAYYRKSFDSTVADLRRELDDPDPDPHTVAMHAMQAAWLARIWPVLHTVRVQWRNQDRQGTETAATLALRAKIERVVTRYREQYPKRPTARMVADVITDWDRTKPQRRPSRSTFYTHLRALGLK